MVFASISNIETIRETEAVHTWSLGDELLYLGWHLHWVVIWALLFCTQERSMRKAQLQVVRPDMVCSLCGGYGTTAHKLTSSQASNKWPAHSHRITKQCQKENQRNKQPPPQFSSRKMKKPGCSVLLTWKFTQRWQFSTRKAMATSVNG
jgi:hypothetical protein